MSMPKIASPGNVNQFIGKFQRLLLVTTNVLDSLDEVAWFAAPHLAFITFIAFADLLA